MRRHLVLRCGFVAFFALYVASRLVAAEPAAKPVPPEPAGPMWDMARLSQVPGVHPAEGFKSQDARPLFYDGVPYRGKPTRVFAWLGIPKTQSGQKVPGMVLVHGGGGTAFDTWVRLWTQRGYAAIAMDLCGCVPAGTYGKWQRHDAGGPPGWGGYGQIDEPREDQWTYHAIADAILGHSLLRAQKEVDPERIGVTGISWGGYLTSILAGVDHRFKLAVPVYGCGFTNEHGFAKSIASLGPERGARWMRWWDPSSYLKQAALPVLWVNGSNDFAYTLNAYQKSYRLPTGPRTLCIRLRMPHGHGAAGEAPKEIGVFADSILRGGVPLAKITGQGREGREVWVTYESQRPIKKVELNVTRDLGPWQQRKWDAIPAAIGADTPGRAKATLPEGVTVYYLNLFDDRDCVVSSEHEELTRK
jgi:dienelactone hydrolase